MSQTSSKAPQRHQRAEFGPEREEPGVGEGALGFSALNEPARQLAGDAPRELLGDAAARTRSKNADGAVEAGKSILNSGFVEDKGLCENGIAAHPGRQDQKIERTC